VPLRAENTLTQTPKVKRRRLRTGAGLLVTNVVHRIRQEGEVITHWTDVYSVYVEEPNEADLKALR